MNSPKSLQKLIGVIAIIIFLTGCAAPTATPKSPPTFPPPPPMLPMPPTPAQPAKPTGQPGLFKFIQTIQITPDSNFLTGGFARINYVPAADRFVVTFGGEIAQPSGGCKDKAYSYKVYTTDMQETGKSGVFSCAAADAGSTMVGNTYYFASMIPTGWQITKYDAVTWKPLADTYLALDFSREASGDMTVAYVNGQIDVSDQYNSSVHQAESVGNYQNFFSADLQFLGRKILTDTPLISGSSMIYVDGIYYIISANNYTGDLVVAEYDTDWKYLGIKNLIQQAHWSQGVAFDGQRFYVAYLDTSQRTVPGFFPVYLNVHLAAFDRDWNLINDVAVTNYTAADNMQTGRPWVILHGNKLYVSYDLDTRDPVTHEEQLKGQSVVSVYELTDHPEQQSVQPAQPTGQASTCSGNDLSSLAVLRSTDYGATWTSLGNACIQGLKNIISADPTPLVIDGRIMLYFVDLGHLEQPVPQIIYRASSVDGVNFDTPKPAYTQTITMVDPYVLLVQDGSFRLYVPSGPDGIISAVSSDGLTFTREGTVWKGSGGGMPGALQLSDGRVRLFIDGGPNALGLVSLISNDGRNFTAESGVRIPKPTDYLTLNNPEPIRLSDGSYLMLYQTQDKKHEGRPEWDAEIHLATSTDGFNWIANPSVIGYGGTSCVVEIPDGTLFLYYGTR